jgi:hypothetical protein
LTLSTPGGGAVGVDVGEAVALGTALGVGEGSADDDGTGVGFAEARGVAVAVVCGGVDPDDPHETHESTLIDPNIAAKKLPRWKRISAPRELRCCEFCAAFVQN